MTEAADHLAAAALFGAELRAEPGNRQAEAGYHERSMSTVTNGRADHTKTTSAWSVHDSSELYEVGRWGNGYFSVNSAGHV